MLTAEHDGPAQVVHQAPGRRSSRRRRGGGAARFLIRRCCLVGRIARRPAAAAALGRGAQVAGEIVPHPVDQRRVVHAVLCPARKERCAHQHAGRACNDGKLSSRHSGQRRLGSSTAACLGGGTLVLGEHLQSRRTETKLSMPVAHARIRSSMMSLHKAQAEQQAAMNPCMCSGRRRTALPLLEAVPAEGLGCAARISVKGPLASAPGRPRHSPHRS